MAALMLASALEAEGLDGRVTVDSAGTTGYEAGRPIDPRAARRLGATQIVSDRHVAREWQDEWFRERDLILALDVDHFAWLREAAPDQESMDKVRMLRSFDPKVSGGQADFDAVWQQIHGALPGIIRHVRSALTQAVPIQRRTVAEPAAGTL
jgi:protein-tyrosine phosphatase